MILNPGYFKQKALKALKGNWQTPMLVLFFSEIFAVVSEIFNEVSLENILAIEESIIEYVRSLMGKTAITEAHLEQLREVYDRLYAAIMAIPTGTWILIGVLWLLSFVITPALKVSADHYFVEKVEGEEAGLKKGIFSCLPIWGKCLWMNILIEVKVFLWSLLFVIPGIIASYRYSMSAHFLSEDHSISAWEAIERSKKLMKGHKMNYFVLRLSFIGWMIVCTLLERVTGGINAVFGLVVAQFADLALNTYRDTAGAAFYVTISRPNGITKAMNDMKKQLKEMGMNDEQIRQAGFENPDSDNNQSEE